MTQQKLGTFSSARLAGDIVFTSGKVGQSADGTRPELFAEEVRAAITALRATLEEHGSDLSALLQVHCILSDMSLFEEFDAVYAEMMPAPAPPRFTHSGGLVRDFRFEIVATAAVLNA